MTQDALKLALEALEANDQLINGNGTKGGLVYCMDGYYSDCFDVDPINKQTDEAIAAIKEALAQRTWVGLTDDDTFEIGERLGLADVAWVDLMQAIESKLKQKNGWY